MKQLIALSLLAIAAVGLVTGVRAFEEPKPEQKKDAPKAQVAELGKPAPDFTLTDLDGKTVKLSDHKGKIVVLEWFQPGCPYCVEGYSEKGNCRTTSEKLTKEGVVWLLVNSNNAEHPDSKTEPNKNFFKERKLSHTVLMDTPGTVGRAYGAKTTPHCFVIDAKGNLAYRGAIDNAQEKDAKEKVNYVEAAVAALKNGKAVEQADTKSYGCSVKYGKAKP
ncbi:MAG: redoxin family protein [Planctomycetia bacterium]